MDKVLRLTPQQRDDLVAYLDGELDEETAEALERTLASSPVARHEVDMLTRTWALIDDLPRPSPSQELAVRTLTTIQADGLRAPVKERLWYGHARRGFIVAGLTAVLAMGAFSGYRIARMMPDEHARLIEELDVIENLDDYTDVSDIKFLNQLQSEEVFDEEPDAAAP